jgi:hypothetical protein
MITETVRRGVMVMPGIYTLRPAGDIDLATADVLVAEWFDLVDPEAATKVLVDLGGSRTAARSTEDPRRMSRNAPVVSV